MVMHTCNPPSTREAEVGGLKVPDQCGLLNATLSQKKKFIVFDHFSNAKKNFSLKINKKQRMKITLVAPFRKNNL
jgi:hypothetical protein